MQHKKGQGMDERIGVGLIQREIISIWREVDKSDTWQNPTNMICCSDNNKSVMFLSGNFQPFLAFKLFDPDNRKKKINKTKIINISLPQVHYFIK